MGVREAMPELPNPKPKHHPITEKGFREDHPPRKVSSWPYAELQVTSNFTFLTGASHPDELATTAAALGYHAIAITDCNTVAGIVRAHVAARRANIRLVVGCRVHVIEPIALSVLVFPMDRAAYARMCRMLTIGKRRAEKGECLLTLDDLIEYSEGLLGVIIPPSAFDERFEDCVERLRGAFDDDRLSIAMTREYGVDDAARLDAIAAFAGVMRVPIVATNDVHYHEPERRPLQDVVTCIRHGCTLDDGGGRLFASGERYLKAPEEMHRILAGYPQALARTVEIAQRARFSLDELRYEYPDEIVPIGSTPMDHLRSLTWAGSRERYPSPPGLPNKVRAQIEHELRLIDELQYAPYFLTVHDIVSFARSKGILCQGRGAAANSAVCYCLGVTSVDPDRIDVLFERFVSKERDEPPDIDIDFEHERREEVIQYLYEKYGRDRAALTAEVISYRGRSAARDVGKALGLSLDAVDTIAKNLDHWGTDAGDPERITELGFNPSDPTIARMRELMIQIQGFPRHLSQHVGGFVITRAPLSELVPIENAAMEDRTAIEWDKDDIDAMGMLKVDCLGLGMLTCIRKAFEFVEQITGTLYTLATIPAEDPAVYDMICEADTIGVFQIESRAQMSMLPRLRPRCFYDLVIEVAIVRPGPIQGDMVHPYLRRRTGVEPVEYPNAGVERVLGKTLGVPLFQEQAMSLAMVAAGFSAGQADQLRRAMGAVGKRGDGIERFRAPLIAGMLERGHTPEYAERLFRMITGFSGYGFPESHAASFALLVYASCWLKRHHPAAFAAALINSQPMGFYQPAQIIRDAKEHGVEVRPIDVNHSRWDCTLEAGGPGQSGPAIRLGTRLVSGLGEPDGMRIADAVRDHGEMFWSIESIRRVSGVRIAPLRALASADAFRSMGLDRQHAQWLIRSMKDDDLPLFDDPTTVTERDTPNSIKPEARMFSLPPIAPHRDVARDYSSTGLTLKAHPMSFVREQLNARRVIPNAFLADETTWPNGKRIRVAGLVLMRQRPSTASGIVFVTIEDETGIANLIIFPNVYDSYRREARHAVSIIATGTVERQGSVVHVRVTRLDPAPMPDAVAVRSRDFH